jgi:hypothetical protein
VDKDGGREVLELNVTLGNEAETPH